MKDVPYWGPTNDIRQITQFIDPGILASGICALQH